MSSKKQKNKQQAVIKYPIITIPASNQCVYTQAVFNNQSSYNQQVIVTTNYAYATGNSNNNLGFIYNPEFVGSLTSIKTVYTILANSTFIINMNSSMDNLEIDCASNSSLQCIQSDAETLCVQRLINIAANTLYSNGVELSSVKKLSDLNQFGFKFVFPDNYNNVNLNSGCVIPSGTTYTNNNGSYLINQALIFTGFDNTSVGTNKFYNAFLEGVPVLIQSSINSNPILPFVYLPAFFTVYKSSLIINDTIVSRLINVNCAANNSQISVVNNTPYTIVIVENSNSYFVFKNTGTIFHNNTIKILLPSGTQKISQDGYEIIALIDDMPQLETMQITHVSNSTNGEFDDYYSNNNTITNHIPSRTNNPALELVLMPKTESNDIYNQTNQPIQITSNSGSFYTINPGCSDNYDIGALINMYTGSLPSDTTVNNVVVNTGQFTVVQSCMFGEVQLTAMPATNSNTIFNFVDRPVLVTANSGIVYTINPGCSDNYDIGAMILMYADFKIVSTNEQTNIVFADRINAYDDMFGANLQMPTNTSSNRIFNHTNRPLFVTDNDTKITDTIEIGCSNMYSNGASILVYDDCVLESNDYCVNIMFGDGIISKTGPSKLCAMPKTSSGDIFNQSDRPIRVISESGKYYNVDVGSSGNFDFGACIILYPLYSITSDATKTTVINRPNMYQPNTIYNNSYGPAINVNIPATSSNDIHNQTDKPLLITSNNTLHTVSSDTNINLSNATVLLYPDMQVVNKGTTTVIQNTDYKLRPTFDNSANNSNDYYFSSNSTNSHRNDWVMLPNLQSTQLKANFPSYAHLQGFYFDWGNTNSINMKD